ncbi:hypothetical protein G4B88_018386 [Cannabis sativa]|uniref:Uncharacterized protein n=1 Tax=Cannabis sativa TaxID=3483 RepID=A0A7J6DZW9_CANSA|nr:hypothetical protein G4B88_018386 [Cannabis sativa]
MVPVGDVKSTCIPNIASATPRAPCFIMCDAPPPPSSPGRASMSALKATTGGKPVPISATMPVWANGERKERERVRKEAENGESETNPFEFFA